MTTTTFAAPVAIDAGRLRMLKAFALRMGSSSGITALTHRVSSTRAAQAVAKGASHATATATSKPGIIGIAAILADANAVSLLVKGVDKAVRAVGRALDWLNRLPIKALDKGIEKVTKLLTEKRSTEAGIAFDSKAVHVVRLLESGADRSQRVASNIWSRLFTSGSSDAVVTATTMTASAVMAFQIVAMVPAVASAIAKVSKSSAYGKAIFSLYGVGWTPIALIAAAYGAATATHMVKAFVAERAMRKQFAEDGNAWQAPADTAQAEATAVEPVVETAEFAQAADEAIAVTQAAYVTVDGQSLTEAQAKEIADKMAKRRNYGPRPRRRK